MLVFANSSIASFKNLLQYMHSQGKRRVLAGKYIFLFLSFFCWANKSCNTSLVLSDLWLRLFLMATIQIQFIKTLWGVTEEMGNSPSGYSRLFARIKEDGFHGVETPIWLIKDKTAFAEALKENDLMYIAMINTCTAPGDNTGSQKLADHLASFERQVSEAKEMNPLLINSHSGCDLWPEATSKAFFTRALEVEQEQGILICHETHRGRILYQPWVTRDLCRAFPDLKLTADLSHFCVVAERCFPPEDEDWKDCMTVFADHCRHIHARVGYAEGPQVPDPSAPEYSTELLRHETWWDQILTTQAAKGMQLMTVEPEHGTDGYQHRLPFTGMETADLWVVNSWIRKRQEERMAKQAYWHK
ncbi:Xylose isomerase [Balamuthia mandrillaris]